MHDWHYFFHHVPQNLDEGIYRIFEPQWKAEILHWFGREDVVHEQKEEFIKALIDFDDGCGDFYRYRAYFLACEALARFPDCSLGDAIVGQLLKWSYAYFRQDKRDWKTYPDPVVKTARTVLEATDRKRVIAAFVRIVHTTKSRSILRLAAERLGQLDLGNKTAIAALVLLIQDESIGAIQSLAKIGYGNEIALSEAKPKAIAALVHLMETTLKKDICYAAIAALKKIGYGNETAITALIGFLQTNRDDNICFEAIETLSKIAPDNLGAIAALVHIIETTQNPYLLGRTAEYLLQIAPGNVAGIAALCQRLETVQDEYFRLKVATNLVKLAPGNAVALNALVQILETTRFRFIRFLAAESLAQTDAYRQKAIDTLLQLAQTFDYYEYYEPRYLLESGDYGYYETVYLPAIACLENIDPTHQLALKTLVELIQTSQDKWIVKAAAQELGRVGTGKEAEVAALVQLLTSTEDECTQMSAAISLGRIEPGNQMAIATLVKLIENSERSYICWRAAYNLGKIGVGDEIAIATLVQFIQTFQDEYQESILCIANSLQGILKDKPLSPIVTALKDYLGEKVYKNDFYRYEAAYSLIWHCAQTMSYPEFYNAWHA
jgi:HEAT repeat protein